MTTSPPGPAVRSVGRDSATLFVAFVVGNAGYFVAVLILARGLGPEGRGTMAFLTVSALVVAHAARLGVTDATTVLAARRPRDLAVLLTNGVAFAAVAGALVGAAAIAALTLAGGARPAGLGSRELAILGAGAVAAAVVEVGYAFLLGSGRVRAQAAVTGSASWFYVAFLAVAWSTVGLSVVLAALVWALGQALRACLLLTFAVRGIGFVRPDLRLLGESFRFGIGAWFGSLARFLNFRADQVLMGFIASEATLGVYAVAVNASEVLIYLPDAAALALLPAIAATSPHERPYRTARAFRVLAVITLAGALAAALLGPALIPLAFGREFDDSTLPFLFLLPGTVGYAALRVFSSALLASGHPVASSLGFVLALVLGIALDLVLIPAYGAEGAAIAASCALVTGGAAAVIAYRARVSLAWRELAAFQAGDFGEVAGWWRRLRTS